MKELELELEAYTPDGDVDLLFRALEGEECEDNNNNIVEVAIPGFDAVVYIGVKQVEELIVFLRARVNEV